jgi:hypothetical protein
LTGERRRNPSREAPLILQFDLWLPFGSRYVPPGGLQRNRQARARHNHDPVKAPSNFPSSSRMRGWSCTPARCQVGPGWCNERVEEAGTAGGHDHRAVAINHGVRHCTVQGHPRITAPRRSTTGLSHQ